MTTIDRTAEWKKLAGFAATGIEVFPPQAEIVDDANMYHLWILPAALPFTLSTAARPAL